MEPKLAVRAGTSGRRRILTLLAGALSLPFLLMGAPPLIPVDGGKEVQTVRFVQDDAQDYMVSKIYHLKYLQANDIAPFVMGIVMRYNMNSSVGNIEYGNSNAQMLTVTCPVKMMPCVDDFIAKADRPIRIDGKVPGEILKGTGITRAVYQPRFRSGENIVSVLVNSIIGEGPWSSLYAYDANSNQIYWKDNSSNTAYVYQFLGYLDRPAPQVTLDFTVYEIRESTLRDIGLEYLAWKNGPGLNIFQAAFHSFDLSSAGSAAITAATGPAGGFFFAPQFDASFIRMLQQSGRAEIRNSASLTVSNSDNLNYQISFDPELQNIIKSDNDWTSVVGSSPELPEGYHQLFCQIRAPIVNIHYGAPQDGYPKTEAFSVDNYAPGDYGRYTGTVFFGYTFQNATVVERNQFGNQLLEVGSCQGEVLISLGKETVLGRWDKEVELEQTIGVPWLCRIPILKYLFSTTTTSVERTRVYVTVTPRLHRAELPEDLDAGMLKKIALPIASERGTR